MANLHATSVWVIAQVKLVLAGKAHSHGVFACTEAMTVHEIYPARPSTPNSVCFKGSRLCCAGRAPCMLASYCIEHAHAIPNHSTPPHPTPPRCTPPSSIPPHLQEAMQELRKSGKGSIVNVTSGCSVVPCGIPGATSYHAFKAAQDMVRLGAAVRERGAPDVAAQHSVRHKRLRLRYRPCRFS